MRFASRVIFNVISAVIFSVFAIQAVLAADEEPAPLKPLTPISFDWKLLRGVKSVAYELRGVKRISRGDNFCKFDFVELQSAVDRMAHNSNEIKFMHFDDHFKRLVELEKVSPQNRTSYDKIEREIHDLNAMPKLIIFVTLYRIDRSCAAEVDMRVSAPVEGATIVATGHKTNETSIVIWQSIKSLKMRNISKSIINSAEKMMKEFFSDWTIANSGPDR